MERLVFEGDALGSRVVGKSTRGLAIFAVLYTLLLVYSAMVPFHFVPIDPSAAWQKLLTMPYVEHGSDQRADWMGNLLMLIPLGYALAGTLASKEGNRRVGGIFALFLCILVVLAIKYLQLFFPPRTVTINYVVAQVTGAVAGIVAQFSLRRPLAWITASTAAGGRGALISLLWLYAGGLAVFILLPFDFVLSRNDVVDRFATLPGFFFSLPGQGLGTIRQTLLLVALVLETMPIGALWALLNPHRRSAVVSFAVVCTATMSFVALFIMGAHPTVIGSALRAAGIVAGASVATRAARLPITQYIPLFGRLAPIFALAYLVILVPANGIRLDGLRGPSKLFGDLDPHVWIPLYLWYNSGKGAAAFAAAAHAVLYLPIGLFAWRRTLLAAFAAAIISAVAESGRMLTGLQPDPNNLLVAAVAAGGTAHFGPIVWGWLFDHAAPARKT